MTLMSSGPGNALSLVGASRGGQPPVLSRAAQRQLSRGLDDLSSRTALTVASEQAEHGLAILQEQHRQELAVLQEQGRALVAAVHEQARGEVTNVAIQQLGTSAAAADAVSKVYPLVAAPVWRLVDAQATGAAMAVMRF